MSKRDVFEGRPCRKCGSPLRIAESDGGPTTLADGRTVSPRYQCEGVERHLFFSMSDGLSLSRVKYKLLAREP